MSNIAIIGYGNVGYHFAKRLSENHEVSIFSRNPESDNISPISDFDSRSFDFIFLCIPDKYIKEVSESFNASHSTVIHTSGSRPLNDLSNHKKAGVIYPLQTFSRSKEIDFETVPIFIEWNGESEESVSSIAKQIGKDVRFISSSDRLKLHLAAVFACNFSNHMYHIAEKMLDDLTMDFKELEPLIKETYQKAIELNPSQSQTGPALRNDQLTIESHVNMITESTTKEIYQLITKSIQNNT